MFVKAGRSRLTQKRPMAVLAAKPMKRTPPMMPMTRSERYLEMNEPPASHGQTAAVTASNGSGE